MDPTVKIMVSLTAILMMASPQTMPAEDLHAISFDDLISLGRIGSFEVSPDGRWIAFEVTWFEKKDNSSNSDIYLVPVQGRDVWRFIRSDASDYSPCWSPDGAHLAFVSDRNGKPQIWVIPTDGGEARCVSDIPTGASHPLWSPDGGTIAFSSRVYPECHDMSCNEEKLEAYEEGKVKRIQQPAYSPQLNPAERVFQYLRAEIEGHVYGTIAAKQEAVAAELNKLAAAPGRIISLAGWDWIRQSVSGLPESNMAFQ